MRGFVCLAGLAGALLVAGAGCSRSRLADLVPSAAADGQSEPESGSSAPPRPAGPVDTSAPNSCAIACDVPVDDGISYYFEIATEFDGFPWTYCGAGQRVEGDGHANCASALRASCSAASTTFEGGRDIPTTREVLFELTRDGLALSVDERLAGGGGRQSWVSFIGYDQCDVSDGFLRWASDLPAN